MKTEIPEPTEDSSNNDDAPDSPPVGFVSISSLLGKEENESDQRPKMMGLRIRRFSGDKLSTSTEETPGASTGAKNNNTVITYNSHTFHSIVHISVL